MPDPSVALILWAAVSVVALLATVAVVVVTGWLDRRQCAASTHKLDSADSPESARPDSTPGTKIHWAPHGPATASPPTTTKELS